MPITVSHQLSATTPDDPAYEIRPSHWNSGHLATFAAVGSEISGAFSNSGNVSFGLATNGYVTASANVTAAASPVNVTGANGSSVNAQTVAFSNSNGLTLGVSTAANGATVTGSYTVPSTAGLLSAVNVSAGSTSNNLSALTFSNGNGVTFGLNASTVTASVASQTVQTQNMVSVLGSTGNISFANGNGITFGGNASTITASHNGLTSQSNQAFSASGGSSAFQTLNFANSNGATFTNTNGSVALSYTVPTVTQYISATNTTFNGTNVSGSITHNTAGLRVDLSVAAPGGAASQTLYATGNTTVNSSGTQALSSLLYRAYGLLSVGTSNGSVLFSAPDTTSFAPLSVGFSTGGNTAGNTGFGTDRVVFAGGANITLSGSTNAGSMTVSIVGGAGGGGGVGVGVSTMGNTAGTTGTVTTGNVVLVGSGPISLSQSSSGSNATISINGPSVSTLVAGDNITLSSAGGVITINGATVAASPLSISAGTTSSGLQSVVFSNSNGVSFGLNGSTITASHNGLTQQSTQPVAVSAANGSYAFSTLSLSNANGISFGTSAGSAITASYTVPTVPTAYVSSVNGSSGALSFATGSSLSSSQNGSTITWGLASNITTALQSAGAYLTTQSGQAFSASGGSSAFQTLSFTNSNGFTFSNTNGSVVGSYTVPTVTQYFSATNTTFNGTNVSGSLTLNTNGLRVDLSVAAGGGGVTPVASASNGSFSFTTLAFSNANNVTFGTSAGSIITASVAAPGAAAENNNIALLGANTAGNTTASGSTIGWSGQGVTLSGTNGSQIVISAPATSSLVGAGGISLSTNGSTITVSYTGNVMNNFRAFEKGNNTSFSSLGQNSLYLQHFIPEDRVEFSYAELWARGSFASSTNSVAYSQTVRYGIYSQDTGTNSSRMTLAGSSSNVIRVSFNSNTAAGFTVQDGATSFTTTSGGTGIIANISGPFHHYLPFSSTLQPNVKHAFAIAVSSTTAVGTQAWRYAPIVQTVMNSLSMGRIYNTATQATATSVIGDREMGVYSVTTGALPSSYATSQISIAVSRQQLPFMLDS